LAWELLRSVTGLGTTVLAACSDAPQDAVRVSTTPVSDNAEHAEEQVSEDPEGPKGTKNEEGAADVLAEAGRA
jgi:hypothetical protein